MTVCVCLSKHFKHTVDAQMRARVRMSVYASA